VIELARFFVPGRPRTKGSLKFNCMKNRAHTVRVQEEVAESKTWRTKVARACREQQLADHGTLLKHEGAVWVRLWFYFARQEYVNGGVIESHETPFPTNIRLGDIDKLTRNILDALSVPTAENQKPLCSCLIKDDSQVVDLFAQKRWADEEHPEGVSVTVTTLDHDET
jgi:Holliday junction resolvase RusA-like endonuclease